MSLHPKTARRLLAVVDTILIILAIHASITTLTLLLALSRHISLPRQTSFPWYKVFVVFPGYFWAVAAPSAAAGYSLLYLWRVGQAGYAKLEKQARIPEAEYYELRGKAEKQAGSVSIAHNTGGPISLVK